MKKRVIFVFILSFLFLINFALAQNSTINGDSVTDPINGKATVQYASLSVNVVSATPSLSLYNPKNLTYLTSKILLNYSASNYQAVWYSLDGGANITLSDSTTFFNTSNSPHTLRLYVNNSDGNLSSLTQGFYMNSTKFIINNTKFVNDFNNTNLSYFAFEELQNMTNLILQYNAFGKIRFNDMINLSAQSNGTGISLDEYTNISSNRIAIDSSNLSNLDKSATITLYGLSFTNPRILKDGDVCSSSICIKESYSSGTLVFNVTGFSTYSADETPSSSSGSSNSGGSSSSSSSGRRGGDGTGTIFATTPTEKYFSIDKTTIAESINQNEVKTVYIKIKAKDTPQDISISSEKINDLIKISDENVHLEANEEKTISIDIIARKDSKPNNYLGKIIVKSKDKTEEVLVSLTIKSLSSLFDINAHILDNDGKVSPGESLQTEIKLFNFGNLRPVDVNIEYGIKNSNGVEIVRKTETLAVETQVDLIRNLNIPSNLQDGQYLFYANVIYNEDTAFATEWFEISSTGLSNDVLLGIALTALFMILFFIILFQILSIRRLNKEKVIDSKFLVKNKLIIVNKPEEILVKAFKR